MAAIWNNACRRPIHSADDIYDRRGNKLWAKNQPVNPKLLVKLNNHELSKSIELCIIAQDPVKEAALEDVLNTLCAGSAALSLAIAQHSDTVIGIFHELELTPQELLLLSLLSHAGRDYLAHSITVTALALALGAALGLNRCQLLPLAHAGLLHDVGRLYFPSAPPADQKEQIYIQHPLVSALAAVELGQMSQEVAQMIACSHERLDGSGFPGQLVADDIPPLARILLFAEAISGPLLDPSLGLLRASVAARLVASEFDSRMVDWIGSIVRVEQGRDPVRKMPAQVLTIGHRLRQLHAQLSRAVVLLSLTIGESAIARETAGNWLRKRINPLLVALRACGVEDALAMGLHLEPGSAMEAQELEAVLAEIAHRLVRFARFVNSQGQEDQTIPSSNLIDKLLRALDNKAGIPA
jgi:hypothetical protein